MHKRNASCKHVYTCTRSESSATVSQQAQQQQHQAAAPGPELPGSVCTSTKCVSVVAAAIIAACLTVVLLVSAAVIFGMKCAPGVEKPLRLWARLFCFDAGASPAS